MKYLKRLLDVLRQDRSYIKDLFIMVVLARLMFLEDNTLVLLAEIVGGLVLIFSPSSSKEIHEE